MWPPEEAFGDPRPDPVRDYVFASAIYEWSAINEADAFDKMVHNDEGPHFDEPVGRGRGASIGPFQGYATQSYKALKGNERLWTLAQRLTGGRMGSQRPVMNLQPIPKSRLGRALLGTRARVPGPVGTPEPLTADQDRVLRRELSDYDNLKDPFVSLIGKMQLSVDYAFAAMRWNFHSPQTMNSHVWRLPDKALRYVLLSYEISGGDDDRLNDVSRTIWKADEEFESGKAKKDTVLSFKWRGKDPGIGMTYNALGLEMAWSDQCRYGELREHA
jgi:hypothetical protein